MKTRLVSKTQIDGQYIVHLMEQHGIDYSFCEEMIRNPELLMCYIARVSSNNQTNPDYAGLLRHCLRNDHWSVFEMVDLTFEIETSRGISPQILRHRSFVFQEFSQRYQRVCDFEKYEARRQDTKNRQNSIDDLSEEDKRWYQEKSLEIWSVTKSYYDEALQRGIAKECARFFLPLMTKTRLYMKGSIRSWIHYLDLRHGNGTQLEHKLIADSIRPEFVKHFPVTAEAKGWLPNGKDNG
jgi:thymidylate synthase (FAD)